MDSFPFDNVGASEMSSPGEGAALPRIESVQLGDRTALLIKRAIISGELAPGAPLRDRELADMLGVSRTPVREALHRLEATGLVVSRGRSGWTVSPFDEQDVRELFQLRRLLEPVGLRALRLEPDGIAMTQLVQSFSDYQHPIEPERYSEYFTQDSAFHKCIVRCSHNRRLHNIYDVLESQIDRGRYFLTRASEGRADETLDEHLQIIQAISERDFERAEAHLIAHLSAGEQLMVEQIRLRAA